METNSFESSSSAVTASNEQVSDAAHSSSSGCSCACSADDISIPTFSASEEVQESSMVLMRKRKPLIHQSRRHPTAAEELMFFDDSTPFRANNLTTTVDKGTRSHSPVDPDKRNLIGCNETHHSDVIVDAENLSRKTESHNSHSLESHQLGMTDLLCMQGHISDPFTTHSSDFDNVDCQTLEDKVIKLRKDMRVVEEKVDRARRSFAERQEHTEALNKLVSLLRRQELLRTVQRLRMQLARQTVRLQTHFQNLQKLSPAYCTLSASWS